MSSLYSILVSLYTLCFHNTFCLFAGPKETWSSPSTVVPPSVSLPDATTCGQVIKTDMSGSFQFPGYPTHARNSNCTYVIQVPRGYGLSLTLPNFQIGYRYRCYISPQSSLNKRVLDFSTFSCELMNRHNYSYI